MKKSKVVANDSIMDRFRFLEKHVVEMSVLQNMIDSYKCANVEETFAQFRIFVRTVQTCIEGLLSIMKTESLTAHNEGRVTLSDRDHEKLTGFKRKTSGSGEVPIKLTFLKDARLTVRCFDEATGGPTSEGRKHLQIPACVNEWPALRNRITHPKTLNDFDVRANDTDVASAIVAWYQSLVSWVIAIEKKNAAVRNTERVNIVADLAESVVDGAVPPAKLAALKKRMLKTLK